MLASPDNPSVIQEVLAGDSLSFAQAARLVPPNRGGKATNPSTLWRWARDGVRSPGGRVHLEVCRIGCRWCTSKAALGRFMAALSGTPAVAAPKAATVSRQTEDAATQAALEALGV